MRECAGILLIGIAAMAVVPSDALAGQTPVDLLWRTGPAESDESARPFSVAGLRLGADHAGDLTVAGRGRVFAPFGRRSALQVQGVYDWYRDRREGQLDIGLVNRVGHVQLGLFSSVRFVNLEAFERGRSLSQFGGTLDYVFATGRVGVYGTAGLQDAALLDRRLLRSHVYEETSLRLVDQFGASWQVDVARRLQVAGHLAILKPTGMPGTTGGSLRVAYPISNGWALTAEGAWNASLVAPKTHGRFTVGIQMGEWPSGRASAVSAHPAPIEIPAIRYQRMTRQVRDGNDGPVADAGPDQVIVTQCRQCTVTVKLDGSGSFDPDGDPLTFRWTPRSGFSDEQPPMPADQSQVTFEGHGGRTYVVRLQVTDSQGATAIDEVTVEVRAGNRAPVADAGDDLLVPCPQDCDEQGRPIPCHFATVTLDGTRSSDPDGDPLTFRWIPLSGFTDEQPPMPADQSRAVFVGREGRTYVVRLQVTDSSGATSFDDVTITVVKGSI